jgi:hypothetical protein
MEPGLPEPSPYDPRRLTIRSPKPLWIGVAAGVVVVAAVGLRLGLPAWRQQVALDEIERLGGSAEMEPVGPQWLRHALGDDRMRMFDNVVWVSLANSTTDDGALQQISGLASLKSLDLGNTNVTDSGLAHLKQLLRIEELILNHTPITGAGLAHLKRLTSLKKLELDDTKMSDAAMAHLKHFPNLESLWIDNTPVTNAGLKHVKELTGLKFLWLNQTTATDAGVIELRRAMPDLVIYYHKSLL